MVSQNRIKEFYSPAPREQCCRCGEQLEPGGAYYWGRIRVCQHCYKEEQEWLEDDPPKIKKLLGIVGWWTAFTIFALGAMAVCLCLTEDQILLTLCCLLIGATGVMLEGMRNHGKR